MIHIVISIKNTTTQDNIESTLKKDFKEFNKQEKENQK